MSRPRSEKRFKAYEEWSATNGECSLKSIASRLGVSVELIRKWKCLDKWNLNEPPSKEPVRKEPVAKLGAPYGNKNALGNPGGAPPMGNKNAVVTGEYETLLFDTLDEHEQILVKQIELNEERLLLDEIRLLSVRERRMLQRINDLVKDNPKKMTVKELLTVNNTKQSGERSDSKENRTTRIEPVLNQIQRIEEGLTRVQARKKLCIDLLYKMNYDKKKFELENF